MDDLEKFILILAVYWVALLAASISAILNLIGADDAESDPKVHHDSTHDERGTTFPPEDKTGRGLLCKDYWERKGGPRSPDDTVF